MLNFIPRVQLQNISMTKESANIQCQPLFSQTEGLTSSLAVWNSPLSKLLLRVI